MSLQVTLDGQSEAIVRAQLAQGLARSPEEFIERALVHCHRNSGRCRGDKVRASDVHRLVVVRAVRWGYNV